jgi:putative transcriptional regulator
MTQEELAQRVGCARQTIIALEAHKYTPSLGLAFRIAQTFNRQVEEVFSYQRHVRKR